MNAAAALELLAFTEMTPIDESDRMSFRAEGCVSENPMIGENDDFLIVLDGDELEIFPYKDEAPSMTFKISIKAM